MIQRPTFFQRFASREPFVVVEEVLYSIGGPQRGADYLKVASDRLALFPFSSLAELEAFEQERFRREILEFKRQYARESVEQELKSREELIDHARLTKALEFIFLELFPMMIDRPEEIDELLGLPVASKTKTGRELLEEMLDELGGNEEAEESPEVFKRDLLTRLKATQLGSLSPESSNSSASELGGVLGNSPFYITGVDAFKLDARIEGSCVFHINNSAYSPGTRMPTENIERLYRERLLHRFKVEALTEMQDQVEARFLELSKGRTKRRKAIERLAERPSFSYRDIGYIRERNQLYVYVEVPKFAMQDPRFPDRFRPWKANKVAIGVFVDKDNFFHHHGCVVEPAAHPFAHGGKYAELCYTGKQRCDNTSRGMLNCLNSAVAAFHSGLTPESYSRHGGREHFQFSSLFEKRDTLSREEAEAQGYMLTNQWYKGDGGGKNDKDG